LKGEHDMAAELVWDHPTGAVPDSGLSARRTAAPDELEVVACALGLISCPSLEASYVIKPTGAGHYALSGTLRAQVEQACVVTLDPVISTIEEDFQADLWPEEDITPPQGGVLELDEASEPEPIMGGQIAVARIVLERLAESLNPYPRKPGATFDWREPAAAGGKPESPFAVLANLKTKR
jgi:uncharacterized metal-binding protein YceD (DUF177 family)